MRGQHKAGGPPEAEELEPLPAQPAPAPAPETAPLPAGWREDTITSFPAITDDTPDPAGPCPCGMHETAEPGKEALLSCAPGVVSRMWRTRVANGQWQDIPAEADMAHARTIMPALSEQRRIRSAIAAARYDLRAMFAQHPALQPDAALARELRELESRMWDRLDEALAESAERFAESEAAA